MLLINMDESSMKLAPPTRKGWVLGDRRKSGASLGDQRSAVTLVAFLADLQEAQSLLPQVFLSNEHVLSKAEVEELNSSTSDNILFSRRSSGWVNYETMLELLEVLAASLGHFMFTHRIVLCMDTYRAHLHVRVVQACTRLGFLLCYIPAAMTAFLQPLDALVFKQYKDWVVRELERQKASSGSGCLSKCDIMRAHAAGIDAVMVRRSWTRAFETTGLRGQDHISQSIRSRLGGSGPVSVSSSLPSAADLIAVYPRRTSIPVNELFALASAWSAPPVTVLCLPKRARLTAKGRPPPPLGSSSSHVLPR